MTTQAAPTPTLDAKLAVGYLIATGGDARLAASRASEELGERINDARLLACIAEDPAGSVMLFNQVKVLALLSALEVFRLMQIAVTQQIPDLSAKDTARSYLGLLENLGKLASSVQSPNQPQDPFRTVLESLPPDAQEAVEFFLKNPEQAAPRLPDHAATPARTAGASPTSPPVTKAPKSAYREGIDVTREATAA